MLSFSERGLTLVNLTNNIILLLQYFISLTLYIYNFIYITLYLTLYIYLISGVDRAINHRKNARLATFQLELL